MKRKGAQARVVRAAGCALVSGIVVCVVDFEGGRKKLERRGDGAPKNRSLGTIVVINLLPSSSCPCQPCFKESFSTDKLVSKRYILLTAAHLRLGLWILSV